MSHEQGAERTALYRLYDANDVLLYIGISRAPDWRMKGHLLDKEWFHLVARRTVQWYSSRSAALAAEAAATAAEKPVHDSSWRRTNHTDKPAVEGRAGAAGRHQWSDRGHSARPLRAGHRTDDRFRG